MCYFDVILLNDVISSIGPKFSDTDTYNKCNFVHEWCTGNRDVITRDLSYMGV